MDRRRAGPLGLHFTACVRDGPARARRGDRSGHAGWASPDAGIARRVAAGDLRALRNPFRVSALLRYLFAAGARRACLRRLGGAKADSLPRVGSLRRGSDRRRSASGCNSRATRGPARRGESAREPRAGAPGFAGGVRRRREHGSALPPLPRPGPLNESRTAALLGTCHAGCIGALVGLAVRPPGSPLDAGPPPPLPTMGAE